MTVFLQIIIMMLVLAAMVMVLLGIRQLTRFEGFEDADETRHLQEEVKEDKRIISENNIFHTLVNSEKQLPPEAEKVYRENSKEPFSPKE